MAEKLENDAINDESYSEVCILCSNTSILVEFTLDFIWK